MAELRASASLRENCARAYERRRGCFEGREKWASLELIGTPGRRIRPAVSHPASETLGKRSVRRGGGRQKSGYFFGHEKKKKKFALANGRTHCCWAHDAGTRTAAAAVGCEFMATTFVQKKGVRTIF
jgi:hypothetical protein